MRKTSPTKINIWLIIGILIGGLSFITGIIITILLFKKKCKEKNYEFPCTDGIDKKKKVKEQADNFLNELKLKIYNKNIIEFEPKCNICNKDFIDNLSRVVTTNCGHTLHKHCLSNHIYKDLNLNCPICCRNLLESNSNLSNPTIYQNNTNNSTDFVGKNLNI